MITIKKFLIKYKRFGSGYNPEPAKEDLAAILNFTLSFLVFHFSFLL